MNDGTELTERVSELEADNSRLRRLLDQRDAPGELRHRLHNTLAMLRTIIRRSAETERHLDSYVAHIEDRLDALARAQAAADERGAVSLHALIVDELLKYGVVDGDRLSLAGPDADLQPRAGQVLALALHELAVNAIEHGALGAAGRVSVECSLSGGEPAPLLTVVWREFDGPAIAPPSQEGFGTEVLTRTLAYELKADTTLEYPAEGALCTIRFSLTAKIGQPTDS